MLSGLNLLRKSLLKNLLITCTKHAKDPVWLSLTAIDSPHAWLGYAELCCVLKRRPLAATAQDIISKHPELFQIAQGILQLGMVLVL